jgi:transposase
MGVVIQPTNMIRSFLKSLFAPAPRVIREAAPVVLDPAESELAWLLEEMVSTGTLAPVTAEERARQLRNDGHSLRSIASELGISYYKARKYTMA